MSDVSIGQSVLHIDLVLLYVRCVNRTESVLYRLFFFFFFFCMSDVSIGLSVAYRPSVFVCQM